MHYQNRKNKNNWRPNLVTFFSFFGLDDAEQPGPSYMNGSANIIQSACSDESEESKVETLREMFPDKDGEQIIKTSSQTSSEWCKSCSQQTSLWSNKRCDYNYRE